FSIIAACFFVLIAAPIHTRAQSELPVDPANGAGVEVTAAADAVAQPVVPPPPPMGVELGAPNHGAGPANPHAGGMVPPPPANPVVPPQAPVHGGQSPVAPPPPVGADPLAVAPVDALPAVSAPWSEPFNSAAGWLP